jgi:hypothetical protein
VSEATELVTSVRQAAATCSVSPFVVRGWIARGLLAEPPWTLDQLHQIRDTATGRERGSRAAHGTRARWNDGCSCATCRRAHNDLARTRKRANAQARLPVEVRQKLLAAIYDGRLFRATIRDLGLTSNQVWGLIKTDQEWSKNLEAALTSTRRDDLQHGTNAAYVAGGVCKECQAHQQVRMGRGRT